MVLRKKCGLPLTNRDRTCPLKRSGAGDGISRNLNAETPRNLSETWRNRQISGGLKAGVMPVKDYNACTIENNTRPP